LNGLLTDAADAENDKAAKDTAAKDKSSFFMRTPVKKSKI
jgi:hypothetical protein